jgi:hypothetical protein
VNPQSLYSLLFSLDSFFFSLLLEEIYFNVHHKFLYTHQLQSEYTSKQQLVERNPKIHRTKPI